MKVIKSQEGHQMHIFGANVPCYVSIAPYYAPKDADAENTKPVETESEEPLFWSIGVNNVSFGQFAKQEAAEKALDMIGIFVCSKDSDFRIPADDNEADDNEE